MHAMQCQSATHEVGTDTNKVSFFVLYVPRLISCSYQKIQRIPACSGSEEQERKNVITVLILLIIIIDKIKM